MSQTVFWIKSKKELDQLLEDRAAGKNITGIKIDYSYDNSIAFFPNDLELLHIYSINLLNFNLPQNLKYLKIFANMDKHLDLSELNNLEILDLRGSSVTCYNLPPSLRTFISGRILPTQFGENIEKLELTMKNKYSQKLKIPDSVKELVIFCDIQLEFSINSQLVDFTGDGMFQTDFKFPVTLTEIYLLNPIGPKKIPTSVKCLYIDQLYQGLSFSRFTKVYPDYKNNISLSDCYY